MDLGVDWDEGHYLPVAGGRSFTARDGEKAAGERERIFVFVMPAEKNIGGGPRGRGGEGRRCGRIVRCTCRAGSLRRRERAGVEGSRRGQVATHNSSAPSCPRLLSALVPPHIFPAGNNNKNALPIASSFFPISRFKTRSAATGNRDLIPINDSHFSPVISVSSSACSGSASVSSSAGSSPRALERKQPINSASALRPTCK